jgi:1-deoxy-D-xylulose-5-phosphate synthase
MIGKGRIMKQWAPVLQSEDSAPLRSVAFFAVGPGVYDALEAGERLAALYPQALITVADARFVKPLDCELLVQLATHHRLIVTIEDGSSGGFAAHVLEALEPLRAVLSVGVLPVHYPDVFEECDESLAQRARAGLSPEVLFLRVQAAWDGEANVREEA